MEEKQRIEILKELPGYPVGNVISVMDLNGTLLFSAGYGNPEVRTESFSYSISWLIKNNWVKLCKN